MKVKIKPYKNYIGPYQIAEYLLFWKNKNDDAVFALGEILAGKDDDSLLYKLLLKIDKFRNRKSRAKVHIDNYDVWNMDTTLSYIILPMLYKLKEIKHGSPLVEDSDIPEHILAQLLKSSSDDMIHLKWEYILNEIIWSFEQIHPDKPDWEEKFFSDSKYNHDDFLTHSKKIDNGLRLFGKYYRGLWD